MAKNKLTPAMEQYMHFKRLHQDAILFFRMGDFYEMFFDDAKDAARLLGLTLTSRNHGKTSGDVPLAGVPHHAMENYLAKLIQMGRKVAICEQVEDPKQAKGVVKRDVVQVVSPGTALSDAMLDGQRNNFLVGLALWSDTVGLASVDMSTGDFVLDEVPVEGLADELQSLAPAEILLAQGADGEWVDQIQRLLPSAALSRIEDWHFEESAARELLYEQLGVRSLKGFGCEDLDSGLRAAGAVVAYLRDNQRGAVNHINRLQRKRREDHALVDATAQRNLELLANQQDGGLSGSLLEVVDHTCTPMGARLLRMWLIQPLKGVDEINGRLDAVDEMVLARDVRRALRALLQGVGDLERLMARICCQRANARDLVALASSLEKLPDLRVCLAQCTAHQLAALRDEGLVNSDEPFARLLTQGMVLKDGAKMSKSKGNTVDPMSLIDRYGADTVRMFTMFASAPDQSLDWSDSGVEGSYRFLKRFWKQLSEHEALPLPEMNSLTLSAEQKKLRLKSHQTLAKVTDDYKRRHSFNTAIAATMELLNAISKFSEDHQDETDRIVVQEAPEFSVLMLAPIVPHFCHAAWQRLGHEGAAMDVLWPEVAESALVQDNALIVLQVNGKLRSKIEVSRGISKDELEKLALGDDIIQRFISKGSVRKVIVVPGKLVNIVTG